MSSSRQGRHRIGENSLDALVMKLKQMGARVTNCLLRPYHLTLAYTELDFESRLESSRHLEMMFDDLGVVMERWINSQTHFPVCVKPMDFTSEIRAFYGSYLCSPFRIQVGGSRFNNLLWLYLLSKAAGPSVIVDSGTYMGASAWALSLGSPATPVYSFDVDLSHLAVKCPRVRYIESDWATFDMRCCDVSRGFCYFDDHVDQVKRLVEAAERGFSLVVFDDDFTIGGFAGMAHGGSSLPKMEFALDDRLRDGEMLSWSVRGRTYNWRVDRGYLDKGRSAIRSTERLPNTSLITGIHQTPYRVVALDSGAGFGPDS